MALEDSWDFLKEDWCPECAGSGWSLDGQHCDHCNAEPVEVPAATNQNIPEKHTPEMIDTLQNLPVQSGQTDALDAALATLAQINRPEKPEQSTWRDKMDEWRENKQDRLRRNR